MRPGLKRRFLRFSLPLNYPGPITGQLLIAVGIGLIENLCTSSPFASAAGGFGSTTYYDLHHEGPAEGGWDGSMNIGTVEGPVPLTAFRTSLRLTTVTGAVYP